MGSSQSSHSDPNMGDIVIVGAGASGISVLLHLIEKVKNGKSLPPITVIEKDTRFGPGLAYSSLCSGTIINMHTDTMGLYFDDPKHFSRWRSELENGPFPSRDIYGEYLEDMSHRALNAAQQLGMSVSFVHDEVTDIERQNDQSFVLTLSSGGQCFAGQVVMAPGNFTSTTYTHLMNQPQFLASPWPTESLKSIPADAPVLVIGSRLSAVDTAIALAQNGHQGPITFMSRSGRVPTVQGDPEPFPRRYALHILAREIEANPSDALIKFMTCLMDEIDYINNGDWSWFQKHASPLQELQADMKAARDGSAHWQTVLRHTAPVIERYWSCLPVASQKLFLDKFFSPWMRYRHGMPIQNAQKILDLMEKSQLNVVAGERVDWDPKKKVFVATTSSGLIEAPYVVEATGQECHLDRISSPLIRSLVTKGLFKPHPTGGVDVNFDTFEAAPGLYIMGTLTRGKHFYVSAIDRVAAHAARIADALTQDPRAKSLHVAILLGSDFLSHIIASGLIPKLLSQGHMPFIFICPEEQGSTTLRGSSLARRESHFFEVELMRDHFQPFLQAQNLKDRRCMTIEQMKSTYGLFVQDISSVDDKTFLNTLKHHFIDVGLSLRGSDRARKIAGSHFSSESGYLLNLKPTFRRASNGRASRKTPICYQITVVSEAEDLIELSETHYKSIDLLQDSDDSKDHAFDQVVQAVLQVIESLSRGKGLPTTESTRKHFTGKHSRGLSHDEASVWSQDFVVSTLVDSFASPGKKQELSAYLDEVVRTWYAEQANAEKRN
ncbi:FAD/NAD(P)-binding domain-containing protein [Aspergillus violaceofuscus CBS 115571]|uniref:FAD/NAD(P)-binding domain-containing protein n=1 Tax=Aspergillus violaceofuscus (strain CBS 115571) TaxID=1450538 RepID=A0A2V5H9J7_ASPV1|nr:FAD/NAD(P)-binding domain-containing protein [Aspergillus violaceofuscus CBS 115571]